MLALVRKMIGYARTVTPGTTTYSTPGAISYLVPEYNTMTVDFKGPGGGGGGRAQGVTSYASAMGKTGTLTGFASLGVYANPGVGGTPYDGISTGAMGTAGANGTGVGGTTNTTGGGAVGGSPHNNGYVWGGPGGAGGRTQKTFTYGDPGAPVPGTTITLDIGPGGAGGASGVAPIPTAGGDGSATITIA